jgi:hypothetical protein
MIYFWGPIRSGAFLNARASPCQIEMQDSKERITVAVFLMLFFYAGLTSAQTTQRIYTPNGYVNVPAPEVRLPIYHHHKLEEPTNLRRTYRIKLKNDSIMTAENVEFSWDNERQKIVIRTKRTQVTVRPKDTKEISCVIGRETSIGFPTDSCWLFKTLEAKVDGYSHYPEPGSEIIAIQAGVGSPVVPFTKANLEPMIISDPKASKILGKGNLLKALRTFNKQTGD